MKLAQVLEQHRKFKEQGLPESFGDGYLMANNRLFRQVRKSSLAAGYRFSSARNESYESFPLLQLEDILRSKVFPYANNVSAFSALSPTQLGVLNWEDVDGNLKKNFVFHEACHGIARSLSQQVFGELSPAQNLISQRNTALRMLLEESCANTCELMGIVDVHDQTHRVFFEMNSYMENFESRTHLKNATQEIGEDVVMKFMFFSYLQANFLREKLENRDFKDMLHLATAGVDLDAKKQKTLRALGKIAFQLNERFRVQTTSFHLRLAGIKTPTKELFDFDFIAMMKTAPFVKFLNRWVEVLTKSDTA